MINHEQLHDVIGATAYDTDGEKIGKIGNVYYDDNTDQPKWLTVHTGLFGGNETFVPVEGSDVAGDGRVTVTFDKAKVKDAPNVSEDGHLSVEEEEQLYRYYNLDGAGGADVVSDDASGRRVVGDHNTRDLNDGVGDGDVRDGDVRDGDVRDGDVRDGDVRDGDVRDGGERGVGHDTSGPNTDEAMTRSEEQLAVGTEQRETGRARLRKHIVSENVSTTVPVSHEEVTLEREPITEANRGDAVSGADLTEEEHEVTLTEQRAVVDKDVVPVERVRLGTETVTGHEQVDETVRKEVIETDGVEGSRNGGELRDDELRDDEARGDQVRGDQPRGVEGERIREQQ